MDATFLIRTLAAKSRKMNKVGSGEFLDPTYFKRRV